MSNPLSILVLVFSLWSLVFGLVMLGLCYSESVKDQAKYQCIAEVSKTQLDKAKELCK